MNKATIGRCFELTGKALPIFLRRQFVSGSMVSVKMERIFVALKVDPLNGVKYTSIYSTPHYDFIRQYFCNDKSVSENHEYSRYSSANVDASSPEEFMALADSIVNKGYNYNTNPIYVFSNWKRFFPIGRLDVADGFHRLAILAALDQQNVMVCKLKYKKNIFARFMLRSYGNKNG